MIKRESLERRREILAAALKILRTEGVSGVTTAKIASEANCSKETIYNWFGDREGLLRNLVEEQVSTSVRMLKTAAEKSSDTRQSLVRVAAVLLDLLTGEASLLINRTAISRVRAGAENSLSDALLEKGHKEISRLVCQLLERAQKDKLLRFSDINEAYATYFGLVIGGRQIRALLGEEGSRPRGEQMLAIGELAVERMIAIYDV